VFDCSVALDPVEGPSKNVRYKTVVWAAELDTTETVDVGQITTSVAAPAATLVPMTVALLANITIIAPNDFIRPILLSPKSSAWCEFYSLYNNIITRK
jgi:hypothetical protein